MGWARPLRLREFWSGWLRSGVIGHGEAVKVGPGKARRVEAGLGWVRPGGFR